MDETSVQARNFIETTSKIDERALGLDEVILLADDSREVPFEFRFEYQGVAFQVVARPKDQGTSMKFRAVLGSLPYTAEDPDARRDAYMIVRSAGDVLGGRVRVSEKQYIMLVDEIWVGEPMTPTLLVSQAARLIVLAKPYLELLAVYIQPPMASSASAA